MAAKNPNDGTGGSPKNAATLSSLAWTLKLDGKDTINGDIPSPIEIPGTGQATIIPLKISLNLYDFFGNRGYDELINLALAIAGKSGSTARITLTAIPEISVAGFPLKYPNELEIIDKSFTNP